MRRFDDFATLNNPRDCGRGAPDPCVESYADPPAAPERGLAQRFFTLSEAGRIFGKSARTMRSWADGGQLRTVSIGRVRYVTEAEIARLAHGGDG